jgi:hypothetical protein
MDLLKEKNVLEGWVLRIVERNVAQNPFQMVLAGIKMKLAGGFV